MKWGEPILPRSCTIKCFLVLLNYEIKELLYVYSKALWQACFKYPLLIEEGTSQASKTKIDKTQVWPMLTDPETI